MIAAAQSLQRHLELSLSRPAMFLDTMAIIADAQLARKQNLELHTCRADAEKALRWQAPNNCLEANIFTSGELYLLKD